MRGLIAEGVLSELSDGRIVFGYQRLGDVQRATVIATTSTDEVRAWLISHANGMWRERGVLGALAVIVPELQGSELIDLAIDDEGNVSYDVVDSFLESLLLRSPGSISPRAVEIVQRLLDRDHRVEEIWDRLLRIACVPGHPLNANWLHARLAACDVAERDRTWSTWLVGAADSDEETAVRRLLEWAWPTDLRHRPAVPDDVARLATTMFGWLLTTSDRRVRDRATKSIVSVAERAPAPFTITLGSFRGVNDPYVVERLAAAACGVALRTDDADATHRIADGVMELVADGQPPHLLTRDFVRRVFGVARDRGWSGPDARPPYGADWPVPTRAIHEIEALAGPPDYAYGSIWHSLTGMGDFGRYVLQPSLRDVVADDEKALVHDAERAIFGRVLDLGWTPERFEQIERGRSGRGRDDAVERVGKKYQWIGLYEVLGRIADHHDVKPSWSDEGARLYAYAEQLVWRDIDPTVLARKPSDPSTQHDLWFSRAEARFPPGTPEDYPVDMSGIPDPLDLIAVTDPTERPWLVLVSIPTWDQPQAPEVEALQAPRLSVWMRLHAYLVPVAEAPTVREWAVGRDWYGLWMPGIAEPHNVLLGAHPDDPEWSAADGQVDPWEARVHGALPAEFMQCAAWYGGTGTSRDASAEEETRGYVPTRRLVDALGLSRGVDFSWSDPSGVAVCDPSIVSGGPAALTMRRDLVPQLAQAGLTLFWTVLIGNELHRRDHSIPGDEYRWVTASASYLLDGERIELVGATAARCRPGPETEHELIWEPRRTEA